VQSAFYSADCFYKRSEHPADSLRVRALHYCNNIDKQEDKRRKRGAKQTKKKAKKKGNDTNENNFDGGAVE
jgi:hypothetical protein